MLGMAQISRFVSFTGELYRFVLNCQTFVANIDRTGLNDGEKGDSGKFVDD
jgi:hypothetical protein